MRVLYTRQRLFGKNGSEIRTSSPEKEQHSYKVLKVMPAGLQSKPFKLSWALQRVAKISSFRLAQQRLEGSSSKAQHVSERWLLIHATTSNQMEQVLDFLQAIECDFTETLEPSLAEPQAHDVGVALDEEHISLTNREIEVLLLLGKGCKYQEIAALLECCISTVQQHIKCLYKKLNVHSRSQAVHEAVQMGLISL